ncbi:Integral inner nuclear membrane protein ima1 [Leucoagaricus sp. SymC.cos]|nr:Integral inner nuclear membrane protein ima1 [Leucoagaricus sp. SymC.cos]
MSQLFRRHSNIACFFCHTAVSPFPKNPRNFKCPTCGCWNRYDVSGEIVSDEPAMHDEALNKQSFLKRGNSSLRIDRFPTSYGPGPFCHTCQTNQMLIVNLLSSYLPPPESSDYAQRAEMLPDYRESLHTRYPPVCENCRPAVEDEIRRKDQMARSKALGAWLKDSKGKDSQRRVSGRAKVREKDVVELYWWKIRGGLWLATATISLLFYASAILGYRPFFFLNLLQPIFPLVVLSSILWTVWDPTYASFRRAQRQGREVKVIGKKEYIILQMIIWTTRLFTSVLFWLQWRNPSNDYFELYHPSSQLARIYFSTITAIEVTAQILSFYRLRLKQPPAVRLIDTSTYYFAPSRSATPRPSGSGSRGATPVPSSLPPPKASVSAASEPDLLAALSLSSKPVITPKNPVFGLPSLLSNPPPKRDTGADDDDMNEDENAMDWTPTDPRAAASRKRKNNANQSEDVWLRPQKFFAPEKPTGLESLFARTTLEDDAMMVDDPEESTSGGSIFTRHFKRWWWIYATVIIPVIVAVVVRRVWHLEITITSSEKASIPSVSSSSVLPLETTSLLEYTESFLADEVI